MRRRKRGDDLPLDTFVRCGSLRSCGWGKKKGQCCRQGSLVVVVSVGRGKEVERKRAKRAGRCGARRKRAAAWRACVLVGSEPMRESVARRGQWRGERPRQAGGFEVESERARGYVAIGRQWMAEENGAVCPPRVPCDAWDLLETWIEAGQTVGDG